jgi:hypothetical protein
LLKGPESLFSFKIFPLLIVGLLVTLLIDTSFVKLYDIVHKDFVSNQTKVVLFSVNSSVCLLLGAFTIRFTYSSFKRQRLNKAPRANLLYIIPLISFVILGGLTSTMIFQLLFEKSYKTITSQLFVAISYGIACVFIIRLSLLFASWYKSNHSLIVLLYFISMSLIAFNLIMTIVITDLKLTDRQEEILEYVGGSVDISVGRYVTIENIYEASVIASFFSIWITTAILMNLYKERLINVIIYWILLSVPLVYFLINFLFQFILLQIIGPYLTMDPTTFSIISAAFLSLSLPIGGLTFAIAFWKISRLVSYEINIRTYMVISGWGILLVFSANQATLQTLTPYPPFGLATLTVLVVASFLMLLGIYNSATLVSINNDLRNSIHRHALESRLLDLIGHAEMENEIQKTVTTIIQSQADSNAETKVGIDLDENELKRYLDVVLKEVKKDNQ